MLQTAISLTRLVITEFRKASVYLSDAYANNIVVCSVFDACYFIGNQINVDSASRTSEQKFAVHQSLLIHKLCPTHAVPFAIVETKFVTLGNIMLYILAA